MINMFSLFGAIIVTLPKGGCPKGIPRVSRFSGLVKRKIGGSQWRVRTNRCRCHCISMLPSL